MLNNSPLSELIHSQAKVYGEKTALSYRDYSTGTWKEISWNQFSHTVALVANALVELGAENKNIIVLDADLSKSTMTKDFKAKFPERFFNAGIPALSASPSTPPAAKPRSST